MLAPIALLLAHVADVAGVYETHQMEVAAALELRPDHRFRYALTYGAVDEYAEGDWTLDGPTLHLTSNPMPRGTHSELLRNGRARFNREPLEIKDGNLLLRRYDTTFRFVKDRP